jgi:hypothetical protein
MLLVWYYAAGGVCGSLFTRQHAPGDLDIKVLLFGMAKLYHQTHPEQGQIRLLTFA